MAVSLPTMGFRSWRAQMPARRRGVYTLGPVRVSNTDAFGIFRRERFFCDTEQLIVYPRTHYIPEFAIPAADLSGDSSTRRRSHDLTPHASSVREYAFGDSISRVHWGSTAKLGKLMSKEFDLGQSSDVWVLVDLHRDVQAGELEESTDEYAVSIGASLSRKYLEAGLPVGLISQGDRRYFLPADTGAGQFDRILEFLALSKSEGSVALETLLAQGRAALGLSQLAHSHHALEPPRMGYRAARANAAARARGGRAARRRILRRLLQYRGCNPSLVSRRHTSLPRA